MNAHEFDNPKDAITFMTAGNARVTLVSQLTGTRFTYRIQKPAQSNGKPILFVQLLNGADNENNYVYLGQIYPEDMTYVHGRKSRVSASALSAKAFVWSWQKLVHSPVMPDNLEVWHEGQCGRCGRALTVPESIASGFGPECAGKLGM